MRSLPYFGVFLLLALLCSPSVSVAQIPAEDQARREQTVEQGEDRLGGAVLDAGENLAKGLENSLKQEAQRDLRGVERKILPERAADAPRVTPTPVADTLGDIQRDIEKLESEEIK